MVTKNRAKGNQGEDIAAAFLEAKGYTIIARQWRCKIGEIDIVAAKGGQTVFVEVKALRDARFGLPESAIRPEKARRLARLAEWYAGAHQLSPANYRIDVVAVELRADGTADVRHHEHALADLPFVDSRRGAW